MGRVSRVLKTLFGAVIFCGVIWFLYAGILANHSTTTFMERMRVPSAGTFKHLKLAGRESHHPVHRDLGLNYESKRRVPSGPDPIHNRRVSQSRQPPGRT